MVFAAQIHGLGLEGLLVFGLGIGVYGELCCPASDMLRAARVSGFCGVGQLHLTSLLPVLEIFRLPAANDEW